MQLRSLVPFVWLLGCSTSPSTTSPESPSSPREQTELRKMMKEEVNPTFSKLTFLAFHAEEMDDPVAARGEMAANAARLSGAFQRLRNWPDPPTQSEQAREVFFTYAQAVDGAAQKLVSAVATGAEAEVKLHLEQISKTCNDCHHFFRLDIEDSVVGPSTTK